MSSIDFRDISLNDQPVNAMMRYTGEKLNRRRLIAGAASFIGFTAVGEGFAREVMKEIASLRPGEFTWHAERQQSGPVAIVVSLSEQRVHVYRNGIRIAVATCSTGKPGHETPTGVFVVLQKDKHHRSSTYDNAAMPNMNRLTWSGIALHAGRLPGYPASHGCVRLPMDFSERLFEITHLGTPVIISGAHTDPEELVHPGMVLSAYAEHEFGSAVAALKGKSHPSDWTEAEKRPVTSIIASSADRRIMLVENSDILAEGSLHISGGDKLGSHVFVLDDLHDGAKGLRWIAISHNNDTGGFFQSEERAIARLKADESFLGRMRQALHPGAVLIVTDAPLSPDSRSGKDFVIMS
ncbi:ErfK/YbiS/YcfS/YnhG family protein [Rhizobium sp. PDO1-076]|nr:ErfK/YbiS/YcfS/YnhG family protein [Rhizobium sp. PDO1-076]